MPPDLLPVGAVVLFRIGEKGGEPTLRPATVVAHPAKGPGVNLQVQTDGPNDRVALWKAEVLAHEFDSVPPAFHIENVEEGIAKGTFRLRPAPQIDARVVE